MTAKYLNAGSLKVSVMAIAFGALLSGCAAPKQGPMFEHASTAIRAAQTAGALEHAPDQYMAANAIYRKAEAMQQNRRTDRAQKLLELATAQASLAKAMSEAALAESSLTYIRTGMTR